MNIFLSKNMFIVALVGLSFLAGAFTVVLTNNQDTPLEFREVNNTNDFLYYDLWINSTIGQEWDPYWYFEYNSQLKEVIIKIDGGIIINITLLCMEEGYFIKYPDIDFVEMIPYGFNASYLGLHTSLAFSNVNSNEFIIRNISFWKVIK